MPTLSLQHGCLGTSHAHWSLWGRCNTRHNQLRDCIADFSHKAYLSPQIERGSGILPKDQSRPADIQVPNWSLYRPAAFDIKVINPLNLQFIHEAAQTCGHAAEIGEEAKHSRNDEACALRGWSCIPLVVEVWGMGQ